MYCMADIHTHLIPGVDDGSFTMDMSKSMLLMSCLQGVRTIFTTPHSQAFVPEGDLPPKQELVQQNYRLLEDAAKSLPFGLRVFLGCEVRCELRNIKETLEHLRARRIPSMNRTRYVLTEFSVRIQPEQAYRMMVQMLDAGWIPIIAHAERYPGLFRDGAIEKLLDKGCRLQINTYSLDDMADEAAGRVRYLLGEQMVSFLGTDCHRLNHRPPSAERGLKYLYAACGREYADAVAFGNAEKYLIRRQEGCERE